MINFGPRKISSEFTCNKCARGNYRFVAPDCDPGLERVLRIRLPPSTPCLVVKFKCRNGGRPGLPPRLGRGVRKNIVGSNPIIPTIILIVMFHVYIKFNQSEGHLEGHLVRSQENRESSNLSTLTILN